MNKEELECLQNLILEISLFKAFIASRGLLSELTEFINEMNSALPTEILDKLQKDRDGGAQL